MITIMVNADFPKVEIQYSKWSSQKYNIFQAPVESGVIQYHGQIIKEDTIGKILF